MGSSVSRVVNTVTRPMREYNLQDRAHKAVIKNKYVPSPKHHGTDQLIQKTIDELPPDVKQQMSNIDSPLEERLRQVYVTSQDVIPDETLSRNNSDRPLPLSKEHHKVPEYGFFEPKVVPYGKVTLKNALKFISDHQTDPEVNSLNSISLKHKLDQRLTEQVLKYFGTFRLFVPAELTDTQKEMLQRLQATSTDDTADLKYRLKGVAMSHMENIADKVPLKQLPQLDPNHFEPTLWTPNESGKGIVEQASGEGIKDFGTDHYIANHAANDSKTGTSPLQDVSKAPLGKSSSDDTAPTKSDVLSEKIKKADAT